MSIKAELRESVEETLVENNLQPTKDVVDKVLRRKLVHQIEIEFYEMFV